jgi:oxaloacetate decarboxylase alpha subunit
LGYIPLVTPTSQIVGTQAVMNVLSGQRYKSISRETAGVLKGEYGATPAAVNAELRALVLEGAEPITCRPADLLAPELQTLTQELTQLAVEQSIKLNTENKIDDVLTYALFPQVGLKFLQNRGDKSVFEPHPKNRGEPNAAVASAPSAARTEVYDVAVNGKVYSVQVAPSGDLGAVVEQVSAPQVSATNSNLTSATGASIVAPLAGTIVRVPVRTGDRVSQGDVVLILEAMKMETEIRAPADGIVNAIDVAAGDAVAIGVTLMVIG